MIYILLMTIAKILGWVAPCIAISIWIVNRGLKTTKIRKIIPQIEVCKSKSLVGKRYMV